MKGQKLLRNFSKEDIQILRDAYGEDNYKCRCGCVMLTFDFMTNIGKDFTWLNQMIIRL